MHSSPEEAASTRLTQALARPHSVTAVYTDKKPRLKLAATEWDGNGQYFYSPGAISTEQKYGSI